MRSGGWTTWVGLLVVLLLALPCLLPSVGVPPVVDPREQQILAVSTETFSRSIDRAPDWLTPTFQGEKQLESPPGLTWLHLLIWHRLNEPGEMLTQQQALYSARLAAGALILIAVLSVYWIGHSIGGGKAAMLAGLVFLANPLVIFHGRTVTMESAFLGMYLLSVAGALWAIRPLRSAPSVERQFIGWTICGVAMGAAQLFWGFAALAYITAGVLVILVLCPGRIGHLLGLLAALLIGVLMALPWAVYVFDNGGNPWATWIDRFASPSAEEMPERLALLGRQLIWIPIFLLPWTWWLLLAVTQPWSSSSRGARTRLLIGWAFLLVNLTLLLAMPGTRELHHLLPIMAAGAVVLASLFGLFSELSSIGLHPPAWRWGRWPFIAMLIAISFAIPSWLAMQSRLIDWRLEEWVVAEPWPWYGAALLGAMLLALTGLAIRWTRGHYPFYAATVWAIWGAIAASVITITAAST